MNPRLDPIALVRMGSPSSSASSSITPIHLDVTGTCGFPSMNRFLPYAWCWPDRPEATHVPDDGYKHAFLSVPPGVRFFSWAGPLCNQQRCSAPEVLVVRPAGANAYCHGQLQANFPSHLGRHGSPVALVGAGADPDTPDDVQWVQQLREADASDPLRLPGVWGQDGQARRRLDPGSIIANRWSSPCSCSAPAAATALLWQRTACATRTHPCSKVNLVPRQQ